jgi:protein-lysine methyltransferase-like protein
VRVVNLRHEPVHLDDPGARELIVRLDGSRDRAALLADFDGVPSSALDDALDRLAELSLLCA